MLISYELPSQGNVCSAAFWGHEHMGSHTGISSRRALDVESTGRQFASCVINISDKMRHLKCQIRTVASADEERLCLCMISSLTV